MIKWVATFDSGLRESVRGWNADHAASRVVRVLFGDLAYLRKWDGDGSWGVYQIIGKGTGQVLTVIHVQREDRNGRGNT